MRRPETADMELRVAVADFTAAVTARSTSRWHKTVAAMRAHAPHVVLARGLSPTPGESAPARIWATANEAGLVAVPGPPAASAGYLAVLACPGEVQVTGEESGPGWQAVTLDVVWLKRGIKVITADLPADSAVLQRAAAEQLAAAACSGEYVIAGGGWHSYGRDDEISVGALNDLPDRMRIARTTGSGGRWAANYAVHDVLRLAGLADAAVVLPAGRVDGGGPVTAPGGVPREDRVYVSWDLVPMLRQYREHQVAGSAVVPSLKFDLAPGLNGAAPAGTSGRRRSSHTVTALRPG